MSREQGPAAMGRGVKEAARAAILEEAHIVASTLSFAGSAVFARMSRPFDVVVVDEAAQATEPSLLVPLVTGAKQVPKESD